MIDTFFVQEHTQDCETEQYFRKTYLLGLSLYVAGCGRHPRSRYEHRDDDSRVGRHRRGEGAPSGWGRRGRARPFFDDSASSGNITLIEGQTAMMECVVKHVGNKSVSQSDRGGNSRSGRQSIIRLFNAVSCRHCTAEATF